GDVAKAPFLDDVRGVGELEAACLGLAAEAAAEGVLLWVAREEFLADVRPDGAAVRLRICGERVLGDARSAVQADLEIAEVLVRCARPRCAARDACRAATDRVVRAQAESARRVCAVVRERVLHVEVRE